MPEATDMLILKRHRFHLGLPLSYAVPSHLIIYDLKLQYHRPILLIGGQVPFREFCTLTIPATQHLK